MSGSLRSENMIHSHKNNSNPNRYSTARAVKQYDLEEKFIGEYRSTKEAARETECSEMSIYKVLQGLSKSTKGYVFKYSKEDVLHRPGTNCSKKVDRIDEKGDIIETYENVRKASIELGIAYYSIYSVLGGVNKKTKTGYRFKYH